ncbi:MAG: hypothetical protein F8N36_14225 [Desulfovibrio sp.]|uniref:hypothetical protein n=1 Tax=Desulfovibrio sp. TaxID=885 RepID=UPI00135E9415|nr:hypothetical protein [Desulfovibrio sp.]MTJ93995.1 hypothetical protein [Desulfovibrio sp.]
MIQRIFQFSPEIFSFGGEPASEPGNAGGAVGKWPAAATGKSLAAAGHLSTARTLRIVGGSWLPAFDLHRWQKRNAQEDPGEAESYAVNPVAAVSMKPSEITGHGWGRLVGIIAVLIVSNAVAMQAGGATDESSKRSVSELAESIPVSDLAIDIEGGAAVRNLRPLRVGQGAVHVDEGHRVFGGRKGTPSAGEFGWWLGKRGIRLIENSHVAPGLEVVGGSLPEVLDSDRHLGRRSVQTVNVNLVDKHVGAERAFLLVAGAPNLETRERGVNKYEKYGETIPKPLYLLISCLLLLISGGFVEYGLRRRGWYGVIAVLIAWFPFVGGLIAFVVGFLGLTP